MATIKQLFKKHKPSQNIEEFRKLRRLLNQTYVNIIVEIGVHKGGLMRIWDELYGPYKLIGIEKDITSLSQEFLDRFDVIVEDSHSQSALIQLRQKLGDSSIDLLFIDGDHSYKGVKEDYETYAPLVRTGGVIVFHDVATGEPEVRKFWLEIAKHASNMNYIYEGGTGYGIIWK